MSVREVVGWGRCVEGVGITSLGGFGLGVGRVRGVFGANEPPCGAEHE